MRGTAHAGGANTHALVLTATGPLAVEVVAEIRQITGLDLRAAADLANQPPVPLLQNISLEQAEAAAAQLAAVGASVEIK